MMMMQRKLNMKLIEERSKERTIIPLPNSDSQNMKEGGGDGRGDF
jgi:hypothetical protein